MAGAWITLAMGDSQLGARDWHRWWVQAAIRLHKGEATTTLDG